MLNPLKYSSEEKFISACSTKFMEKGDSRVVAITKSIKLWENRGKGRKLNREIAIDSLALPVISKSKEDPDEINFSIMSDKIDCLTVKAPEKMTLAGVQFEKGQEIHYTLGVVLEPETVDLTTTKESRGDIYSAEEVAKACHRFNLDHWGEGQDVQHNRKNLRDVVIVESFLAPVEMNINGQPVREGTWLAKTLYLNDEIWEQVSSGKLSGLSIEGSSYGRLENG